MEQIIILTTKETPMVKIVVPFTMVVGRKVPSYGVAVPYIGGQWEKDTLTWLTSEKTAPLTHS